MEKSNKKAKNSQAKYRIYVNNRYRLVRRVAAGNYGLFYEGFDEIAQVKVGVKMEGTHYQFQMLAHEAACLR